MNKLLPELLDRVLGKGMHTCAMARGMMPWSASGRGACEGGGPAHGPQPICTRCIDGTCHGHRKRLWTFGSPAMVKVFPEPVWP